MIEYRHFAPKKYKCLYCGHSPFDPMEFGIGEFHKDLREVK